MNKAVLVLASILGVLSIVLGAFGAHALKNLLTVEALQTFETGVRYQMYHALFLLFVGNTTLLSKPSKKVIFYLVLAGVLFFSGSIYLLATNALTTFNFKVIGFVTPIGGLLLVISWMIVFVNFFKIKS